MDKSFHPEALSTEKGCVPVSAQNSREDNYRKRSQGVAVTTFGQNYLWPAGDLPMPTQSSCEILERDSFRKALWGP